MPKKIDQAPISVERTRKTLRYEIVLDNDGALVEILAHRWLFTYKTSSAEQASSPEYKGLIRVPEASVPQSIKNRIADMETLIDAKDL